MCKNVQFNKGISLFYLCVICTAATCTSHYFCTHNIFSYDFHFSVNLPTQRIVTMAVATVIWRNAVCSYSTVLEVIAVNK